MCSILSTSDTVVYDENLQNISQTTQSEHVNPKDPESFSDLSDSNMWSEEQWCQFRELMSQELSGESLMKKLGYSRRKDLESLVFRLSQREGKHHAFKWDCDRSKGEHSLPDLRVGKESLRLSHKRLERILGTHVPRNTYVSAKKIADNEIKLTFFLTDLKREVGY